MHTVALMGNSQVPLYISADPSPAKHLGKSIAGASPYYEPSPNRSLFIPVIELRDQSFEWPVSTVYGVESLSTRYIQCPSLTWEGVGSELQMS